MRIALLFVLVLALIAMTWATPLDNLPEVINAWNIRAVFNSLNNKVTVGNEEVAAESTPNQDYYTTHDPKTEHLYTAPEESQSVSAWNLAAAKQRAGYSSIARCLTVKPASVDRWTCKWCNDGKVPKLTQVTSGITGSEQLGWYVGYDKTNNKVVIVYRSTNNFQNWIVNLDFGKVAYPASTCSGCNVHKGFLNAYQVVKTPLMKAVSALITQYPSAKLLITGHSQGGALTTHAVLDLKDGLFVEYNFNGISYFHNHNPQAEIYNDIPTAQLSALSHLNTHHETPAQQLAAQQVAGTKYAIDFPIYNFGSPRVGNEAFSDFFNKKIGSTNFLRVTRRADTVPHVPIIAMGFKHVGQEMWLPKANPSEEVKVCSATNSEDKTCSDSQIAIVVTDHQWYLHDMLQQTEDCQ